MATESKSGEPLLRVEVPGIEPDEMKVDVEHLGTHIEDGKVEVHVENGKVEVTLPAPGGN
jgi:hypothetical protein